MTAADDMMTIAALPAGTSSIEWTEQTWNPISGCTKVSAGCKNCYAETMAGRLRGLGVKGYENGFALTLQPDRLNVPLRRKKPTIYFVNSMSDLFHPDVPFEYIDRVFAVIRATPQHTYQILTKRPTTMRRYFRQRRVPPNAWLGVTVENKRHGVPRIDILRQIDDCTRFLSVEPLLEDIGEINLTKIDWVIVGGESGSKARRMMPAWVENVRVQCRAQKTKFFFKQWGTFSADGVKSNKKKNGRLYRGRTWNGFPVITLRPVA